MKELSSVQHVYVCTRGSVFLAAFNVALKIEPLDFKDCLEL